MILFKNIIKKIQKSFSCPICKKRYSNKEIVIRAYFDNIFIIQATCYKNHNPVVTLCILPEPEKENNIKRNKNTNITKREKINFCNFLKKFDGNFKKHFSNNGVI